jgi:uncharacterized protein YukE
VTFKVEPEALRQAASKYRDNGADLAAARDYNNEHSKFEWHEVGYIATFNSLHNDFAELLKTRLAQAADLLGRSADTLARAAGEYESVDEQSAAALDATYPPAQRRDSGWHGL